MSDTTVLVAGATGSLGSAIVRNLLDRGATVRALVRPASADGGPRLRGLAEHPRLSLRVGDLSDGAAALTPHLDGAEVVISAVQGGPEVIIDGQRALLTAAEAAGVHRMIPSDFSINLWGYDYGVNLLSDLRRTFADSFRTSSVARTSVSAGAFPEYFLGPFHEVLDPAAGTFSIWGDGDRPIDVTTIPDTAAYTAAIALDPSTAGREVQVAGEQLTLLELRDRVEAASGRPWTTVHRGSLDDLRAEIVRRQFTATNPFTYVALQYQWGMYSGRAALTDLRNADYPDVVPATVADYLAGPGAAHVTVPAVAAAAVPAAPGAGAEWPSAT